MLKYAVHAWDAPTVVYPNFRRAKAAWRKAMKVCYTAWIKPYRGPVPYLGHNKKRPFEVDQC